MDENIPNAPQDAGNNDSEAILRDLVVRLSTFPGDPRVYNAQLLAQQLQYTLYIQANMETSMSPSGGWFSSSAPMTML